VLSFVPSSGPNRQVFELGVSLGPSAAIALSSDLELRGSLLAGINVHIFDVRNGGSGARADWTAQLPVGLRWVLTGSFALEGAVFGGVSGRERSHDVGDQVAWRRGAVSAGILVGLSYGFGD
jgi:hypothetical protein